MPPTSMIIPSDIWLYISEFIDPWERNPYLLLKMSHISRSARSVLLSWPLWRYLNPNSVPDPSQHFLNTISKLLPSQRKQLSYVWSSIGYIYDHGTLEKSDTILYKIIRHELPGPFDDPNNLYYQLGVLLATTFAATRRDIIQFPISDRHMLKCAVNIMPFNWERAVPSLKRDKSLALEAISTRLPDFDNVSQVSRLSKNVDGLLLIATVYTTLLKVMPPDLRNDREFMQCAVAANWRSFLSAGHSLREDHEFTKRLIDNNVHIYRVSSIEIRSDPEIILDVVARDKSLLRAVPQSLVTREVLMAAFRDTEPDTSSIRFRKRASDPIQQPPIVAVVGRVLVRSPMLISDRKLMKQLVKYSGIFLRYADHDLKNDPELQELALASDGAAILYIPSKAGPEGTLKLLHKAVKSRPDITSMYSEHCDNDELLYAAVNTNGIAYLWASPRLKSDRKLYSIAIDSNIIAATVFPREFLDHSTRLLLAQVEPIEAQISGRLDTKELILASLDNNPDETIHLSSIDEHSHDPEVVLKLVKIQGLELYAAPKEMVAKRDIVFAAMTQNPAVFEIFPSQFTDNSAFQTMFKLRVGWQVLSEQLGELIENTFGI